MKSPQDMRIIQIDITNACIHKCSNCTRFCGHHKKPFFMDWETFKKAADSFEGYNGTVGIMGGEPTLHPEFERFVNYIKGHPYFPKTENLLVRPAKNFMTTIARMEQRDTYINKEHGIERRCVHGFGLWSALSEKYRDYYELIQDTFNFQAINDHTAIMYHSPIFVRRRDLGIPDEEWIPMRDQCWAQREWSATITPKGAFFCEIAGALDMLFDGPGGWKIEPGWWKRTPDQFGDQLNWCELCGIAFSSFTRDANEEIDDMSAWYYDALSKIESPKLSKGLYNILDIDKNGNISEESKAGSKQKRQHAYTDSYFSRFNNNWLNPKSFEGFLIADDVHEVDSYKTCILKNKVIVDHMVVAVTNKYLFDELEGLKDKNVDVYISEYGTWGSCINLIKNNIQKGSFVVLLDRNGQLKAEGLEYLKSFVLNPGSILVRNQGYDLGDVLGTGIKAIFSMNAYAINRATWPVIREKKDLNDFVTLYDDNKVIPLHTDCFRDYNYQIEQDKKYVMYGIGSKAEDIYQLFSDGQVVAVADSSDEKIGKEFHGMIIKSPSDLYECREIFDKIFVSSRFYFEIKTSLIEMGFRSEDIVTTLLVL